MRTTVDLPDDLLLVAKARAAESGRTLGQVVEDALRALFERFDRASSCGPLELPTFRGSGLRPGVYLDDSAALLGLIERDPRFPGLALAHPPASEGSP